MVSPCSAAVLFGAISLTAASMPGQAHTGDPEPDIHRPGTTRPLIVAQNEAGFSIQAKVNLPEPEIARMTVVRLGSSHAFDSRLFERTIPAYSEIKHAAQH